MIKKALILAAGQGSRLHHHRPKPSLPVLGLPLLIRTLFTLQEAGIKEVFIVVGYRADEVKEFIKPYHDRLKIRVHWLENPDWHRPNGRSVLRARGFLKEPFLLTMCDHIFDPQGVRKFLQQGLNGYDLILAVERDLNRVNDLEDATRVRTVDGKIERIGKLIPDFDAVDTGLFLATPELFDALEEAVSAGKESLSDGVQVLAQKGKAGVVEYEGRFWQDVDTPDDVRLAKKKLLASLTKPTDGPVSRYLNRPISRQISRILVRTPVRPGMITLITFGVGLLSAWIAARGGYQNFLIAGILFQFASILDGVDGEIARLKFHTSRAGEWLDTLSDNLTYLINLVALTVGTSRMGYPSIYITAGVLGFVFALLSFISLYIYLFRTQRGGTIVAVEYGYEREKDVLSRLLQFFHLLGKRDVFSAVILILAIFGHLSEMLIVFFVVTLNLFVFSIVAHIRIHTGKRVVPYISAQSSKDEPKTVVE